MENQNNLNHSEIKHESTLYAEHIYHIGHLPITNSLLTSWIVVFVILIISIIIRLKLKQIPKGIQNFFEIMINGALSLCDQVTGSRKISKKVFPLVFTIFLFILLNNWLGIFRKLTQIAFFAN